ncbi:MAG: N-acetyl-D-muramate 6-phosphate phosphatase [Chloroflexia bacterium]|jgi:HAD superfamily hydrolase (TIGR01509 family)|nr:N-acetyl-D-muramate 6-phosphate phosphatase [Chloroflexia bacterium]
MNITNLKAVLFDWDGTIVDSAQAMFLSYRHAYEKHLGIVFPRDYDDFLQLVPMRLAESSAKFGGEKATDVANSYNEYYEREGYKMCGVYEGVREVLVELRAQGYLLGVASNKSWGRIGADIDYLGLEGFIDAFVTSEDTPQRKPHPAPLLKLAEKLEVEPQHCAYIGDYHGDIIAARDAGMLSIAVMWGGMFPTDTLLAEHPDYVVERPEDLLDLFPGPRTPQLRPAESNIEPERLR